MYSLKKLINRISIHSYIYHLKNAYFDQQGMLDLGHYIHEIKSGSIFLFTNHLNKISLPTVVQYNLQVRTVSAANKKVQDIWHMPNYFLISWVPKTGKNKKIQ